MLITMIKTGKQKCICLGYAILKHCPNFFKLLFKSSHIYSSIIFNIRDLIR